MAILPSIGASAMHGALVPIAKYISSGVDTGITFSSIPQNYQDLRIVISGNIASGSNNVYITLNGDFTGSTGSGTKLVGNGSSASSTRRSGDSVVYFNTGFTTSSTIQAVWTVDILNYANSSTYKTILWRFAQDLNGSGTTELGVGLKQLTSATNSVVIQSGGNNWASGTTVFLYGIRSVGQ
jgi:hypothetical protein